VPDFPGRGLAAGWDPPGEKAEISIVTIARAGSEYANSGMRAPVEVVLQLYDDLWAENFFSRLIALPPRASHPFWMSRQGESEAQRAGGAMRPANDGARGGGLICDKPGYAQEGVRKVESGLALAIGARGRPSLTRVQ
jgi:hypothetical protein